MPAAGTVKEMGIYILRTESELECGLTAFSKMIPTKRTVSAFKLIKGWGQEGHGSIDMNEDSADDLVRENAILIGVVAALVVFGAWMMGVPL